MSMIMAIGYQANSTLVLYYRAIIGSCHYEQSQDELAHEVVNSVKVHA